MSHEETRAHPRKIWKLSVQDGAWGSLEQLTAASPPLSLERRGIDDWTELVLAPVPPSYPWPALHLPSYLDGALPGGAELGPRLVGF